MNSVLVFKTSIGKKRDVKLIRPFLNELLDKNARWNFDLEDCDNILRIETQAAASNCVSRLLNDHGFLCQELH